MSFKPMTSKAWEATAADKIGDAFGAKRSNMTDAQYERSGLDSAADKIGVAKYNADASKKNWQSIPGYNNK